MEELKFRAWDNTRNEYLSAGKVFIPIYPSKNPESNSALNLDTSNFLAAEGRMVIEQFTNQKDDEGKELYTDDIVCISGSGNCIVGISPLYGVTYTCIADDALSTCAHDVIAEQESIFLIGNTHQNTELLKGKN